MSEQDHFDRALEALLADRSPRAELGALSDEERRMVSVAQLLRGQDAPAPEPEFTARLARKLAPRHRAVSRRAIFLGGIGTLAAGLLAGIGIEREVTGSGPHTAGGLVGKNGRWIAVAQLSELPPGGVRPFTAGAVHGFLVHSGTRIHAVSRICTHMGCALKYAPADSALRCPCHGAEFDLQGNMLSGPGGYYAQSLPPLPRLNVRVREQAIEVWSV